MRAAIIALVGALIVATTTPLEKTLTKVLVTREIRRWIIWLLQLWQDFSDWLQAATGC